MSAATIPSTNPTAQPGFVVEVDALPTCDFCGETAHYDFRTFNNGPWAFGCQRCYLVNRQGRKLGVGFGQRLIVRAP